MSSINPKGVDASALTFICAFRNAANISNPDTGVTPMGTFFNSTSLESPQFVMPDGRITRIGVELNGGAEFSSGTINFILEKNDVEIWSTGAMSKTDFKQGTSAGLQNQVYQWFDVDIELTDTDFITAYFETNALAGGPEGMGINLWGRVK